MVVILWRWWHLYCLNLRKCLFRLVIPLSLLKIHGFQISVLWIFLKMGNWQYPYHEEDLHKIVWRNPYILMCTWISNFKLILLPCNRFICLNLSQFRIIMLMEFKFRCMTHIGRLGFAQPLPLSCLKWNTEPFKVNACSCTI